MKVYIVGLTILVVKKERGSSEVFKLKSEIDTITCVTGAKIHKEFFKGWITRTEVSKRCKYKIKDEKHLDAKKVATPVIKYSKAWLENGFLEQKMVPGVDRRCRQGTFYDYHGKIRHYRGTLEVFYLYVNTQFGIHFSEHEKKILERIFEGHYRETACRYDNCLIGVNEVLIMILGFHLNKHEFPLKHYSDIDIYHKYFEGSFPDSIQTELEKGKWDRIDSYFEDICNSKGFDTCTKNLFIAFTLSISLPIGLLVKLMDIVPNPVLNNRFLLDEFRKRHPEESDFDIRLKIKLIRGPDSIRRKTNLRAKELFPIFVSLISDR